MSRFKIGDRIKAKKGSKAYESYGNKICIVEETCDGSINTSDHVCYKDPISFIHNGWTASFFELVDRPNRTEVEMLDCFQNNFREGV
jgi:hypothetical protein